MKRKYWLNRWMPICLALELHSFQILTQHRTSHRVCVSSSSVVMQSFTLSHSLSIFLPPLGSFYPIKFIKSNMWMWHQRHRQLCYLHFAYWYVRTMCVRAFLPFLVFFFCLLQWILNVVHNACVSIWIADVFCFFRCICSFCSSILNCFAYTWPDDAMHLLDGDFSDD